MRCKESMFSHRSRHVITFDILFHSLLTGDSCFNCLKFDMTAWIMKGTREEFGIIKDQWIDERLVQNPLQF